MISYQDITRSTQPYQNLFPHHIKIIECLPNEKSEYQYIGDEINRILSHRQGQSNDHKIQPKDIAILYRHNKTGKEIKSFLQQFNRKIPLSLQTPTEEGNLISLIFLCVICCSNYTHSHRHCYNR
jgi:hypothetical protein